MSEKNNTADREFINTRTFDAPVAMVWDAWSSAENVAKWYGPNGFLVKFKTFDLREGGSWEFTMDGHGTSYPNFIRFHEVIKHKRISYSHGQFQDKPAHFDVVVTFEEKNNQTTVTMSGIFPTKEALDFVKKERNAIEGGKQTMDRLGDVLYADRMAIATRTFDVSSPLMWKAWSQPEHLSKWWGPKGFSNTFRTFEFRAGGNWEFTMHGPDGKDYPNESAFIDVTEPKRIMFVHLNWPKFRCTVVFEDENGKTKLTFRQLFESAKDFELVKPVVIPSNEEWLDRLGETLKKLT